MAKTYPEREAVEQPREDVQREHAHHVRRIPPHGYEAPPDDRVHLRRDRHRILPLVPRLLLRRTPPRLHNLPYLLRQLLVLGRRLPHVSPVLTLVVRIPSPHRLEHVLGGILLRRTRLRAVPLEIVEQRATIPTQLPEVHGAPPGLEEQQVVEVLEQHRRRLVDGAQDGLAGVGQLPEEAHDGEGGAAVEARRGLVQEHEQRGLAGELDADGDALALLLVEPAARHADGRARHVAHLEQVDDLLHVRVLLLQRDFARLAQPR